MHSCPSPSLNLEANGAVLQVRIMVSIQSLQKTEGDDTHSVHIPEHVYLGRQPLLNAQGELWAYEIFYRKDDLKNKAEIQDPGAATATVVMNMLADLGVERVVGAHKMLINCPKEALRSELLSLLPKEQVILEVHIDMMTMDNCQARIEQLVEEGFQFALHGEYTLEGLKKKPPPSTISHIKVDITGLKETKLSELVAALTSPTATLIAEKVETLEQFKICQDLGFEIFQGYYFCQPEIVKGRRTPANQLAVMELLAKISEPNARRDELCELIGNEVGLSFRLLRTLNSAAFGLAREVKTIEHALTLLGDNRLREWVGMLVVSNLSGKPNELSRQALLRAYMCEHLARHTGKVPPQEAFTVGLFSVLDTMMGMKMRDIVKGLPLANEIRDTLMGRRSIYSPLLSAVIGYEIGKWKAVDRLHIPADELIAMWMKSTRQMEEAFYYMKE